MTSAVPRKLGDLPISVVGGHAEIAKLAARASAGATLESRLEALELDRQAHLLVASYAYFYDAKDLAALMALYADDATLVNSSGTYIGKQTIEAIHREDLPLTEISFHHLNNVVAAIDQGAGTAWASAYMYNLAIRDGAAYGTVATIVFALRHAGDAYRIVECRIAIDSRHNFDPRQMVLTANKLATVPRTSAELVGVTPRYPK
jgi:ketosteroid isomerase-like protein